MGRKRQADEEFETIEMAEGAPEALDGEEPGAEDGAEAQEPDGDRVQQLEAELAEMKDRYLRSLADMDNVRRRARLDVEESRKFANERVLTDLLPVLDNFARALEAADQNANYEALKDGVDLIHRQLTDLVARAGLEKIEAVGQPFDPNLHEAIMQVEPGPDQEPHQVVEELRAGYKLNERVLRPSLVKVTSG
jgi:molecular chaperone GrpE